METRTHHAICTVARSAEPLKTGSPLLLPARGFRAVDGSGRPEGIPQGGYLAAALIARAQRGAKIVIDYAHQTLHAAENGKSAARSPRIMSFGSTGMLLEGQCFIRIESNPQFWGSRQTTGCADNCVRDCALDSV